jgi:hypothetical protein
LFSAAWRHGHAGIHPLQNIEKEKTMGLFIMDNPNRLESEILDGLFSRVIVDEGHTTKGVNYTIEQPRLWS